MNQDNTLLECPICMEYYVCPKILSGCGHTICNLCVKKLSCDENILCPMCNKLSSVESLNTNYVVQDLVHQMFNNKDKYRVNLSFSCPDKKMIIENSIKTNKEKEAKDDSYVIARPVLSDPVSNNNIRDRNEQEVFQFDEEIEENKRECCNIFYN